MNGKSIIVAGVNRHDHDPDHGKTISMDRFIQDIVTLKRDNFNAIRTCHYPNSTEFYKLCDYLGMYVCDEANIEVHGMQPMGKLVADPAWTEAFATRVTRMCERDRNHASIIIWSLGNESGRGCGLTEARRRLRSLDPSRPIMYESGGSLIQGSGRTELTDIICPMYAPVADTLELGTRVDEDRPVILCEFTHAMGNSNGNLDRYWDLFWDEDKPRIQGGWIWDMIDQGLRKVDKKTGREFWAYGGDFGEEIHDFQFCINGLYSPEREPHPAVAEVKYLQQPVKFTVHGDGAKVGGKGKEPLEVSIKIKNRHSFIDLSHLELSYSITCDTSETDLASGKGIALAEYVNIKAASVTPASLLDMEVLPSKVWLSVKATLKEAATWAPKGHVVATEQFEVALNLDDVPTNVASRSSPSVLRKLTMGTLTGARTGLVSAGNPEAEISVSDEGDSLNIAIDKVKGSVIVDKKSGGLLKMMTPAKKTVITGASGGVIYNFTRAATDNDRGGAQVRMDVWSKGRLERRTAGAKDGWSEGRLEQMTIGAKRRPYTNVAQ